MSTIPLLEVKNLTKVFKIGGIVFGSKLKAVEGVNLTLEEGNSKILTLAGESGSGKTTLSRVILGLVEPTEGKVLYEGKDVFNLKKYEKEKFKQEVQPVFQNPYEAFNPLRKVDRYLTETARNYKIAKDRNEAVKLVSEALSLVRLSFDEIRGKYSHEISGGQAQRTAIARALVTRPRLLIADEPVSMVDTSLRMNILNILLELKEKLGMSIIYITHDLATAYYISDDIAIMYRGNIVEYGPVSDVLTNPLHPYTKTLIECIPKPNPKKRWSGQIKLSGLEIKEFEAMGCKFADRCPRAKNICSEKSPPETEAEKGNRMVKCWLYE